MPPQQTEEDTKQERAEKQQVGEDVEAGPKQEPPKQEPEFLTGIKLFTIITSVTLVALLMLLDTSILVTVWIDQLA